MYNKPPNKIVYVDPKLCVGCHSCEMSCAIAHSDADDAIGTVGLQGLVSRTHVVSIEGTNVPMQCRQCEDAPCAKVCPTGAMIQSEGLGSVYVNEQSCIGCKLCSMVCPFGVVSVVSRPVENRRTNNGIATKCDLCTEWRAKNGKTQTACEEACHTHAIRLIDLQTYRAARVKARAAEIAAAHQNLQFSL